jgi:hypothetical protein
MQGLAGGWAMRRPSGGAVRGWSGRLGDGREGSRGAPGLAWGSRDGAWRGLATSNGRREREREHETGDDYGLQAKMTMTVALLHAVQSATMATMAKEALRVGNWGWRRKARSVGKG